MRRLFIMMCLFIGLMLSAGCTIVQNRTEGRLAYQQGRYADAVKSYRVLLENERAEDMEVQSRLGLSYLKLGDLKKARFHLEQAVELSFLDPDNVPAMGDESMDGLAETLYLQKDNPRLVTSLERMKDRLGRVKDYVRLGIYLQKFGDLDNGLVALRQGVRLNIQRLEQYENSKDPLADWRFDKSTVDVSSFMALSDLYAQINQTDRAVMTLRNAYYFNPEAPGLRGALENLGVAVGQDTGVKPDPFAIP